MWHLWGLAAPPPPCTAGPRNGDPSGEYLARRASWALTKNMGFILQPGRLSKEKGVGLRKDPCGGGFENRGGSSWSPGYSMMTGDLGGRLSRTW